MKIPAPAPVPIVVFQAVDDAHLVISDQEVIAWHCPRRGDKFQAEACLADGTVLTSLWFAEIDDCWADVADQLEIHKFCRGTGGLLSPARLDLEVVSA